MVGFSKKLRGGSCLEQDSPRGSKTHFCPCAATSHLPEQVSPCLTKTFFHGYHLLRASFALCYKKAFCIGGCTGDLAKSKLRLGMQKLIFVFARPG